MLTFEERVYPIGKYEPPVSFDAVHCQQWMSKIEELPNTLADLALHLNESDMDKRYRKGGWSVRQIFHHIADSHTNAFVRLKLALTEEHPTIAPYDENKWAEMADSTMNVAVSLRMIEAVHARMCMIFKSMKPSDFERTYFHPGYNKTFKVYEMIALYAWHGKHHEEQIRVALSLNQNELD
jgi:hypothetical protein